MRVLGIWDGHDAGAALLEDGAVTVAVNEERLTRRKLEVRFPTLSIEACLRHAGLDPGDIDVVACSTSDWAKALARLMPATKEDYYRIRRRKTAYSPWALRRKRMKYWLTLKPGNRLTDLLSRQTLLRALAPLGFGKPELVLVDHHLAHAAAAAWAAGFPRSTVVTIDGLGDGISATVNRFQEGRLKRLAYTPAADSLGVFFEHVTNLLNMRELEDEGKVMALATYAYPVPDDENPMLDFFAVDGLALHARMGPLALYDALRALLWSVPSEQFAFMAQRALEVHVAELVQRAVSETGISDVALAGGAASNIKVNMALRELAEVDHLSVFPHMGDGGLALGAAVAAAGAGGTLATQRLEHVYWGPSGGGEPVDLPDGLRAREFEDAGGLVAEAAERLAAGEILLWFQGRMEYGPRALGHRSILARPDRVGMRDRLNRQLKKRVWYQPFCPSLLDSEAATLLENAGGQPNRFMTMGYRAHKDARQSLAAVLGADGTCRPQFVRPGSGAFADLLAACKAHWGTACVLNTSMNVHGEPLVHTLEHAFRLMRKHGFRRLFCPDSACVYEWEGKDDGA